MNKSSHIDIDDVDEEEALKDNQPKVFWNDDPSMR